MPTSLLSHLECSLCGREYPADRLWNLCPECSRPLLCRYDLEAVAAAFASPEGMDDRLHLRGGPAAGGQGLSIGQEEIASPQRTAARNDSEGSPSPQWTAARNDSEGPPSPQRTAAGNESKGQSGAPAAAEALAQREPTMWRYYELLPIRDERHRLTLGEGWTPLMHARRLGAELRFGGLYVKDEGLNPTGSFKARGLSVAVSRALELGVRAVSIPSAGNAAGAMSAYAALGGLEAHVFMPADVPPAFIVECRALGADVNLVDGLITDCGRQAAEAGWGRGWFDLSTLK
ncbi:MAG: pyridoxal-phosphate dependent enzyme, partial [Anaerolineae bacterium]|nr:pyridoxal-phosphate dependent enzyme [Anaerolineae bacterium]